MKLIAEYNDYSLDTKIITEANEKGEKVKTYNIEGIFAQADTKNRNGRKNKRNLSNIQYWLRLTLKVERLALTLELKR